MAAPIVGSNGPFGLLLVGDRMSDVRRFDDDDLASFTTLVSHASKALENSRLFEQIQQDAADRTHQALHDALTGLPNRHSLEEDLPAVLDAAEAAGEEVALLLIDLERFKEVNDTLGHQAGDRLLCRVSDRFRETAGERESVYRFGGDEFIVVQRAVVDRDDAVDLAERLRASLDLPFEHDDLSIAVSASIGVAVFPDHATDATDLVTVPTSRCTSPRGPGRASSCTTRAGSVLAPAARRSPASCGERSTAARSPCCTSRRWT